MFNRMRRATARLLGAASAAFPCGFVHCFSSFFFDSIYCLVNLFGRFFFYCSSSFFLNSAHGAFCTTSAGSCCFFYCLFCCFLGATCAGFVSASSGGAGGMCPWQRRSTGTYQSCNSQPGKEFLQVLTVHVSSFLDNEKLGVYR